MGKYIIDTEKFDELKVLFQTEEEKENPNPFRIKSENFDAFCQLLVEGFDEGLIEFED